MKTIFLSFSILSFLLCCNSSDTGNRQLIEHLKQIEKQIVKDNSGGEDFNSFFEYFKLDTIFQCERTDTPFVTRVELITFNAEGDMKNNIITSSNKSDWRFTDWESEKYQRIEVKKDSAIITSIDSVYVREFSTDYIFVRIKSRWYLESLDVNQLPLR